MRGSAGGKFTRIHTLHISFPRCIQCSSKRHGGRILRFKTLGPMAVIIHDARRIVQRLCVIFIEYNSPQLLLERPI